MAETKLTIDVDTSSAIEKLSQLKNLADDLSEALDAAVDVKRLVINPGDALVIKVDQALSADAVRHIEMQVSAIVGNGIKVLVLPKGFSIDVLASAA